jgi:mRNA-degrading endonuclease RelE of RelBE toxin-antitoxin system
MKSFTSREFRDAYAKLPKEVQVLTRRAYRLFRSDPQQPGLRFKRLRANSNLVSVRIGLNYRALGTLSGEDVVWFWVGSHSEYDRLINS